MKHLFFFVFFVAVTVSAQNTGTISTPDTLYKVCLDSDSWPEESEYSSVFQICGYVNAKGEIVIPVGKYEACFSDLFTSFAVVKTYGKNSGACAVDRDGNVLFKVFWFDNWADELSDGMIRIVNDEGKIGYADHTGKIVIEPVYSWGDSFTDGTAMVTYSHRLERLDDEHHRIKTDSWLTIDKTGKVIQ